MVIERWLVVRVLGTVLLLVVVVLLLVVVVSHTPLV